MSFDPNRPICGTFFKCRQCGYTFMCTLDPKHKGECIASTSCCDHIAYPVLEYGV